MMLFSNGILEELSTEGKQYLGSHLQDYLSTLKKEERVYSSVGLRVKIDNPEITCNSLTELNSIELVNKRLNCSLFFCVALKSDITLEIEIMPQHLNTEAFQNLEKTLHHYNMYWKGSSMYISNE